MNWLLSLNRCGEEVDRKGYGSEHIIGIRSHFMDYWCWCSTHKGAVKIGVVSHATLTEEVPRLYDIRARFSTQTPPPTHTPLSHLDLVRETKEILPYATSEQMLNRTRVCGEPNPLTASSIGVRLKVPACCRAQHVRWAAVTGTSPRKAARGS